MHEAKKVLIIANNTGTDTHLDMVFRQFSQKEVESDGSRIAVNAMRAFIPILYNPQLPSRQ